MVNIAPLELVVILAIALVVLGPTKLPQAARTVGRGLREFRAALSTDTSDEDADRERDPSSRPA